MTQARLFRAPAKSPVKSSAPSQKPALLSPCTDDARSPGNHLKLRSNFEVHFVAAHSRGPDSRATESAAPGYETHLDTTAGSR